MNTSAPSIAMVVPEYRTGDGAMGGVTTVADFLYADLTDSGWDVSCFTVRMSHRAAEGRRLLAPSTWFARLRPHVRPDGVTAFGAHLAEFEFMRYLPRRALDDELAKFDACLVIAGSPAVSLVAARARVPVVLQVATMVSVERRRLIDSATGLVKALHRGNLMIVDRLDRLALRKASVVVTENRWMHAQAVAAGASKVELAPPGVDIHAFQPATYCPDGPIVMVARLGDPRKDYPTLFRAYRRAMDFGVSRPLILAGRGMLSDHDLNLIEDLGLERAVEVRTDLSAADLVSLLQHASLFVTSSSEEGLGLSILEAMACGLPVVSTATEGARYILEDGASGELVPIGDSDALAATIAQWLSDSARRDRASSAARERVAAHFSEEATGREFRRIIADALAAR